MFSSAKRIVWLINYHWFKQENAETFKSDFEALQRKNAQLTEKLDEGKAQYAALLEQMNKTQKNFEQKQLECHSKAMELK